MLQRLLPLLSRPKRVHKPCEWIYFPKDILPLLEKYKGAMRDRRKVSSYAKDHGLLRPKLLRKLHWRIATKIIQDKDIARFIQSRLGELRISETRYGDIY
ncbi:MAG: hypothetical protein DRO40_08100 [Thermoprotei archaeon]|nr:MAG: hypothetical protein DRO40_08100 [Thermoprotei archaeon]